MRSLLPMLIVCALALSANAQYSGGSGTADDPYQIATAADLIALGETPDDYDKHFILTADIDLDPNLPGGKVFDRAVIAPDTNDTWSDFQGTSFTGVFDGKDHTISHLTITGENHLGLFGKVGSGARILSLGLEEMEVNGAGGYVGGLAGFNQGVVINCHSIGTVSGGIWAVGCLVGVNGGNIIASHSSGTVTGDYYVGGLVGANAGNITASYSSGTVAGGCAGGLVGTNCYDCDIDACYSTGAVTGDSEIGGLVGWNEGRIGYSYSTGAVSGTGNHVGGLVGYNMDSFSEQYMTGRTTRSFWDVEASGQSTSIGGTGLNMAQMQDISTYLDAGWDFADEIANGTCDYWEILPGDYPRLHWPAMPEGLGTAEHPYQIRDARDLGAVWFDPMAHYRLEASVDLSGITWSVAVVPCFAGTFDGNGSVISNLRIQGRYYLGLFGTLKSEAIVSNLGLQAVDVNGTGDYIGGLVGHSEGSIGCSYTTGTVTGEYDVGGLVGYNDNGSITASYSTGAVTGDYHVGGLLGYNYNGSISASYSTGPITGDYKVGGLVGFQTAVYWGDVILSFWDVESSGLSCSAGGIHLTTAEMMDPEMLGLNGFANDPNWVLDAHRDYPRLAWEGTPGNMVPEPVIDWLAGSGTAEKPYEIASVEQLLRLNKASALANKHFKLINDLDLSGEVWPQAVIPYFSGRFDGNGRFIHHLTIRGRRYLGFFGRAGVGAVITNLALEVVDVNGTGDYVGGLVGWNEGIITGSSCTGAVTGDSAVGGLVGWNEGGSITGGCSTGTVTAHNYVGGLVGLNVGGISASYSATAVGGWEDVGGLVGSNHGIITASSSTGAVTGDYENVGGLVGHNYHGSITASSSTGAVTGDCNVGGLVGRTMHGITACYSTGTVVGSDRVGGLVGCHYSGSITACYSTGGASGDGRVGGLVGTSNSFGIVTSCFWDTETSRRLNMCGSQGENATGCDDSCGKTTAEMQTASTFLDAGWDFIDETENGTDDIWWILEGQDYPRLWWELEN